MSYGGWTPPQSTEVAAHGDYGQQAAYAMRPLSLGEILDRSFAVYRKNFWLFVGIGAISGTVQLLCNITVLLLYHGVVPTRAILRTGVFPHAMLGQQIGGGVSGIIAFLATAVTQAATVWALSEVYLGKPAAIPEAVRAVIGRWLRFVGIAFWQGWSLVWLPMVFVFLGVFLPIMVPGMKWLAIALAVLGVLCGLVLGVICFLRNSLGIQSAVVEGLTVRAAMRRSKTLAAGAKGRILVVYLITWCMLMVAGILEMPLSLLVIYGALRGERHVGAQFVMLLVNFVAHSTVLPVLMIGLTLVYFDQRVRQEGFDLLLMLGGGAAGLQPNTPPTQTQHGEPAADAAGI